MPQGLSANSPAGVPCVARHHQFYGVDPLDIPKPAVQTDRIDSAALRHDNRVLNLASVVAVRLIFDRTASGRVIADDIELTN